MTYDYTGTFNGFEYAIKQAGKQHGVYNVLTSYGELAFGARLNIYRPQSLTKLLEQMAQRFSLPIDELRELGETIYTAAVRLERMRLAEPQNGEADRFAGEAVTIADPEPWPTPVSLDEILGEIHATLRRFVYMNDAQAVAVTLWIAHTYLYDVFDCTPRLLIQSPVKGCGKTTLLEVLSLLVRRPLMCSSATPPVIFRLTHEHRPTLLLDEADTWIRNNADFYPILNASNRKYHGSDVYRCVGDTHEPRRFNVFAPMGFAGIGYLYSQLEDRGIAIVLTRKPRDITLDRLHADNQSPLKELASKLMKWQESAREVLATAASKKIEEIPDFPRLSSPRAEDNWKPLLAIADLAGGDWPMWARKTASALDLANQDPSRLSERERLLFAVGEVLDGYEGETIQSTELLRLLRQRDEWEDLSQKKLGRYLRSFQIPPEHRRAGNYYNVNLIRARCRELLPYPSGSFTILHESFTLQPLEKSGFTTIVKDVKDSQGDEGLPSKQQNKPDDQEHSPPSSVDWAGETGGPQAGEWEVWEV